MKRIGILMKISKTLTWHFFVTIYKSFVRPHLDYGDVIYEKPDNESFSQIFERNQYNATLAITDTIKGTFQSKLYSELGFESLKFKCWFRKLWTLLKIKTTGLTQKLFDLIPQSNHLHNTHLSEDVTTFYNITDVFKYFFSPSTMLEWNKLDRINTVIYKFGMSHQKEHKFNYNFKDCVNPLCSNSLEIIILLILKKPSLMNYSQLMKIFRTILVMK